MERPRWITAESGEHLVSLLVLTEGFDDATARRFVDVAVEAVIESYRWQAEALDPDGSDAADARRLLGFVHGNAIAAAVGMSTTRVWPALRTLVPRMLQVAGAPASLARTA